MKARSFKDIFRKINQQEAGQFAALCDLARKQDKGGLFQFLYEQKLDIHTKENATENGFFFDNNTVVMQMALEGNHKSVKLLIETFHANPAEAAEGYARANNDSMVNEFLLQDMNVLDEVARGYALAGNKERVGVMLAHGAKITSAIYGAARAGNRELVDGLLTSCNNENHALRFAMEGYTHSGHIGHAEDMILRTASSLHSQEKPSKGLKKLMKHENHLGNACDDAIVGYAASGYLIDQDKFLKLLSLTKNDEIRKHFIKFMSKTEVLRLTGDAEMSLADLTNKAADIRGAMVAAPDMTYEAALAAWAPEIVPVAEAETVEPEAMVVEPEAKPEPLVAEPVVEAAKPEAEAEVAQPEAEEAKSEAKTKHRFHWFHRREKQPVVETAAVVEEQPATPAPGK